MQGTGPGQHREKKRPNGEAWQKLFMLAIVLGCLCGCARPEPTLVVTVGGLGFSQMGDLRHAIEHQCPRAKVVSAGAWDAYKTDITKIATAKPRQHIIFIGHSFGCQTIDQAAAQLPKVDLAVFIDPAWDDFRLSPTITHYLWYQRSGFGVERESHIAGAVATRTIKGDHNSIPHSPELIAEVVAAVKRIDGQKIAQAQVDDSRKPVAGGSSLVPVIAGR